jgi:clan AA aspartic protease
MPPHSIYYGRKAVGEEHMGHVEVKVGLSNPETGTRADEKGLVDTGATLTVIPKKLAESLRLPIKSQSKAMTAGGPVSVDLSDVYVEIAGKTATVRVAISDVVDRLLIGVTTLETLGLTVDPLAGQLRETYYLLY